LSLSNVLQISSKHINQDRQNKMEPLKLDLSGLSEQQVRQLDYILNGNSQENQGQKQSPSLTRQNTKQQPYTKQHQQQSYITQQREPSTKHQQQSYLKQIQQPYQKQQPYYQQIQQPYLKAQQQYLPQTFFKQPQQQSISQLDRLSLSQFQQLQAFQQQQQRQPQSYLDLHNLHHLLPQRRPQAPQFNPSAGFGESLLNLLGLNSNSQPTPRYQTQNHPGSASQYKDSITSLLQKPTDFNMQTLRAMEELLKKSGVNSNEKSGVNSNEKSGVNNNDKDRIENLLLNQAQSKIVEANQLISAPGTSGSSVRIPGGSREGSVGYVGGSDGFAGEPGRDGGQYSHQNVLDQLKMMKLKQVPRQIVKPLVEDSVPINLPPPQTLHEIQQDQLQHEQLFGAKDDYLGGLDYDTLAEKSLKQGLLGLGGQGLGGAGGQGLGGEGAEGPAVLSEQLSKSDLNLMRSMGVPESDLRHIMQMPGLNVKASDLEEIRKVVNSLTDDEINTLTQMPSEELEVFSKTIVKHNEQQKEAQQQQAQNELQVVTRKRRQSGGYVKGDQQIKEISKRATTGSMASKLAELQQMINKLDEAKGTLVLEMENVKRRANAKVVRRRRSVDGIVEEEIVHSHQREQIKDHLGGQTYEEREKKTIFESMGPKEVEETEGIISRMVKRKEQYDEYQKNIPDPDLSTEQIRSLMAAMKNMIDKIEGLVKNEQKSRKRKKRSTTSGENGSEFSFMEFGADAKGSYEVFEHKHKHKRSLKDLFTSNAEVEAERVEPSYIVPDFVEDKQFTSGRFHSREIPTPESIENADLVRRRRQTDPSKRLPVSGSPVVSPPYSRVTRNLEYEPERVKRHLNYFFPKKSPKEELVYFSVSQVKAGEGALIDKAEAHLAPGFTADTFVHKSVVHGPARAVHGPPQPVHEQPQYQHGSHKPVHEAHPVHEGPQPVHEGPQPVHKGPQPVHKGPQPVHKGPQPVHKGPQPVHKGPQPVQGFPQPIHGEGRLKKRSDQKLVRLMAKHKGPSNEKEISETLEKATLVKTRQ